MENTRETLGESERLARSTVDALSAAIAILDDTGTILTVNKAWRDFTEADAPGVVGLAEGANYLAACAAAAQRGAPSADAFAAGIRAVMRGDQAGFSLEYDCHASHTLRWFIGRVTRIPGAGPMRIVVAHDNITASLVERLRTGAWLQSLIDATQDAVVAIDDQGRIVLFNKAAEQMFGYSRAEVQNQPVSLLMPEPYAREHASHLERYERTHEPRAIGRVRAVAGKRKNGAVFPLELTVAEVTGDAQVRYGAFLRDISEKIRLREHLLERERLAAIGATAATFAHEVGNPLNSMATTLQLLERRLVKNTNLPDTQLMTPLRNVMSEIRRLSVLLDEFRALTRQQIPELRSTSLATVAGEALAAEASSYAMSGIVVRQIFPPDLPAIVADGEKLKQVILNLCKNAVEAMPRGGTLTLRASHTEDQVRLEVSDTGGGIPLGVDIFAPFVTSKAQGAGLGLTIARQIVSAHGGVLTYNTTPGEDTMFILTLPRRHYSQD